MQKKYWRSHCLRSFVRAEGQWFGQYLLAASDRASGLPTEITRAGSVDTQLLETHRAPHSGGPPLGLMSRWWCHLEVRRTVIFTPVFWKWGPVGQRGVCMARMSAVIPRLSFAPRSTEFWSLWEFRRRKGDIIGNIYLKKTLLPTQKNRSTKVDEEKTIFIIE